MNFEYIATLPAHIKWVYNKKCPRIVRVITLFTIIVLWLPFFFIFIGIHLFQEAWRGFIENEY